MIRDGRVIDPESGLDAVRNVGIVAGRVVTVSESALEGERSLDAAGMVVAPGFIDLHQHGQSLENYAAQVRDGITTALELEIGVEDIEAWYQDRQGKAPAELRRQHLAPLLAAACHAWPQPWTVRGVARRALDFPADDSARQTHRARA